jgi:aspartate-semialdehyde dehydrogenase
LKKYAVAVVGATGLVGRKMVQVLEEHRFPVGEIRLLASARSAGRTVTFARKHEPVHELTPGSFEGVDVALFSAGATVSREYAPHAVRAGTLVVDNSSAFRLDPGVPLVVPEVNRADIFKHRGIIANPNCSTIQMVVALKPLHDLWRIRRIVVSTYQSVTGAGKKGLTQLEDEIAQRLDGEKKFPHPIAFNVLPQIDVFLDDGSSKEEYKMVEETKKIMGDDTIRVSATCVRVPVWGGHSESVNVEFEKPCDVAGARAALGAAPGVIVRDDPARSEYPMPVDVWDTDPVYVGRIRRDPTVPSGLNLWIVADNLRKGAATNAVQIAEEWIKGQ